MPWNPEHYMKTKEIIEEPTDKTVEEEIIDVLKLGGEEIKFGAIVKINEDETGKKSTYQLVGEYESDINNKKISINSPLARALIGKMKKDIVEVNSPKGTKTYTVISVKYK